MTTGDFTLGGGGGGGGFAGGGGGGVNPDIADVEEDAGGGAGGGGGSRLGPAPVAGPVTISATNIGDGFVIFCERPLDEVPALGPAAMLVLTLILLAVAARRLGRRLPGPPAAA